MRVIFLDFDGVLNSVQQAVTMKHAYDASALNRVSLGLVRFVCEHTEAKIVVSSVWRTMGIDWLTGAIEGCGWRQPPLIDVTPRGGSYRGDEIATWLKTNPTEKYVILDDDSDMLDEQKPYFIHVDPMVGFNIYDALQAIDILGGKMDDSLINSLNEASKFRTRKRIKYVELC